MIPDISRYANSQNPVSEADFFSNHPYHRRLEEISRRIMAPPRPGRSTTRTGSTSERGVNT